MKAKTASESGVRRAGDRCCQLSSLWTRNTVTDYAPPWTLSKEQNQNPVTWFWPTDPLKVHPISINSHYIITRNSKLSVTGHLLCCNNCSDWDSEQRTCVRRCYIIATYLEKGISVSIHKQTFLKRENNRKKGWIYSANKLRLKCKGPKYKLASIFWCQAT